MFDRDFAKGEIEGTPTIAASVLVVESSLAGFVVTFDQSLSRFALARFALVAGCEPPETTTGVVYEMTRRGKIGHVGTGIVGGRGVRFTRQQVAAFIKSREISPLIRARVRAMCVPARMGRKNTDGSYPENRSALRQSCLAG